MSGPRARRRLAAAAGCLGALAAAGGPAGAQEAAGLDPGVDPGVRVEVPAAAPAPQPLLRRDGDHLVDRPARVVELADGALAAVFDPPAVATEPEPAGPGVDEEGFLASPPPPEPVRALPPMVLQPCRQLDALREVRASGDPDAPFRLSGRVQRYRGRNHLLLTGFAGLRPRAQPATPPPGPPAVPSADGATASVEALMEALDAEGTGVVPAPPPPAAEPGGGDGPGWRDGALVSRRLGRVLRGAAAGTGSLSDSVFVFDGGDPPLRLLPCAVTERAEDLGVRDHDELLFELSGQVHVSGREAWVLPAALLWRPAAGRVDG